MVSIQLVYAYATYMQVSFFSPRFFQHQAWCPDFQNDSAIFMAIATHQIYSFTRLTLTQ